MAEKEKSARESKKNKRRCFLLNQQETSFFVDVTNSKSLQTSFFIKVLLPFKSAIGGERSEREREMGSLSHF